jgi:antitoxin (DNA-binding transcriptional repressor) of toxin-antitoxin stability system
VVISKRGKPMARLVPVAADEEIEHHILARLRAGEGGMLVDEKKFLEPSSRIAGWSET